MTYSLFFVILFLIVAAFFAFWFLGRSNKKPPVSPKKEQPTATPPAQTKVEQPQESQPQKRKMATELYTRRSTDKKPSGAQQNTTQPITEPKVVKAAKELPASFFPPFDNSRLLGMGLSKEDADAFVLELIDQIESTLPQIDEAAAGKEFEKVERLSHSLKGSATNLGTGGVADVLVAFNTYTKTGKDSEIIAAHIQNLKNYHKKLKIQFS